MQYRKVYNPFAVFCLVLITFQAHSQLVVTANQTALALATKLAGPGITISSPVLTCAGVANGTFISTSTPLTIDSGIILTTGRSIQTSGTESFLASTSNGTAGDASLTVLAGATTHDACVLQFDFIPNGDTVSFNYQFGSEEYNNSTCGPYNDAFAFFISGPGIVGTQNMALVPGTNIPVTVNSINNGVPGSSAPPYFCNIANCNIMGPGSPFTSYYYDNTGGTQITYKGYTTKLTALSAVTPCNSYHLKIAIADANNALYDSGVFIEAGSLKTNSFYFDHIDSIGTTINSVPHTIAKGCDPAVVHVQCSHALAVPQTINFSFGGTGVYGVDFSAPSSVVIPAGDTTADITITGLITLPTGTTTMVMYLLSPFSCGIADSITLNILDHPFVNMLTPDTTICNGATFPLRIQSSTGLSYNWTPTATLSSGAVAQPTASPTTTTNYVLTSILVNSGCPSITSNVNVTVLNTTISMATPNTNICLGTSLPLTVTGSATLDYSWTPAAGLSGAATQDPVATPTVTTTYSVTATTAGMCPTTVSVKVTVNTLNISVLTPDTTICIYTSFPIQVAASTTAGPAFNWTPTDGLSDPNVLQPVASPTVTTSYALNATWPGSGCPDASGTLTVSVINSAINLLTTPDTIICYGNSVDLRLDGSPTMLYSWLPSVGLNNATAQSPVATPTVTTVYTVTAVSPGGLCTSVASVNIDVADPRATILTNDTTICMGSSLEIVVTGDSTQTFSWTPTIGLSDASIMTPFAAPEAGTTYVLTATVPGTPCFVTREVTIGVKTAKLYNVSFNQIIHFGSSVQLNADSSLLYMWSPDDGSLNNPNINNPVATPKIPTTYTVYGIDVHGCKTSASVNVDLIYDDIFIPDAFTPNNDGLNDVFRVGHLTSNSVAEMSVYNRWGNLVYHAKGGENTGWDGTFNGVPQDMGAYNYLVVIGKPDGTFQYYKGALTLLR